MYWSFNSYNACSGNITSIKIYVEKYFTYTLSRWLLKIMEVWCSKNSLSQNINLINNTVISHILLVQPDIPLSLKRHRIQII